MILAALIIVIALFSGLPSWWDTVLYVVMALFIIVAAYLMKPASAPVKPAAPYVDHTPVAQAPETSTSATEDTSPLP